MINIKKIENEFKQVTYDKKKAVEEFKKQKQTLINLINEADSEVIVSIENYIAYINIKRTAKRIEEINAKLRVFDYIMENE